MDLNQTAPPQKKKSKVGAALLLGVMALSGYEIYTHTEPKHPQTDARKEGCENLPPPHKGHQHLLAAHAHHHKGHSLNPAAAAPIVASTAKAVPSPTATQPDSAPQIAAVAPAPVTPQQPLPVIIRAVPTYGIIIDGAYGFYRECSYSPFFYRPCGPEAIFGFRDWDHARHLRPPEGWREPGRGEPRTGGGQHPTEPRTGQPGSGTPPGLQHGPAPYHPPVTRGPGLLHGPAPYRPLVASQPRAQAYAGGRAYGGGGVARGGRH